MGADVVYSYAELLPFSSIVVFVSLLEQLILRLNTRMHMRDDDTVMKVRHKLVRRIDIYLQSMQRKNSRNPTGLEALSPRYRRTERVLVFPVLNPR